MKIVIVSDTHIALLKKIIDVPDGDMLIIAGDLDIYNSRHLEIFSEWMKRLPHKYKVIVPGNHDLFWRDTPKGETIRYDDFSLLVHSGIEVKGLKIFGSPYTPWFGNWAFMYRRYHHLWEDIPKDTDVLVTHGPPFGILDDIRSGLDAGRCAGDHYLRNKVLETKPRVHCFGHIHGGSGVMDLEGIKFINASVVDDLYQYNGREITVVDL